MIGVCHDGCLFNLLKCAVGMCVCDVALYCVGEEKNILHRHSDVIAEIVQIKCFDVHTVHQYLSFRRIIETAEKIHYG